MADLKISQLSDGGASQATDEYVVARSGANYRIDGASVAAAATSVGTLSSLTVSGNITASGGTANGVGYLNASKVLTTGTALTFSGSQLEINSTGDQLKLTRTSVGSGTLNIGGSGELAYASALHIFYNAAKSTEWMRLDASGNLAVDTNTLYVDATNNRVGIGTASPAVALDVRGDASIGTHDGSNFLNVERYASGLPYAIIRAGSTDQDVGVGMIFQYRNSSGTAVSGLYYDASGNLGLGVTPSAWSTITALQVKNATFGGASNSAYLFANAYYDGSNFKYIASAFATQYRQQDGQHIFYTAPSGTAGNSITFTQAMTLDASGNLGVGETSPGARLHVKATNEPARFAATGTSLYCGFYYNTSTLSGYIGNAEGLVSGGSSANFGIRAESALVFAAGGVTERARITSGGYFKASSDGVYRDSAATYHEINSTSVGTRLISIRHANTDPYGIDLNFSAASPDNNTNWFLSCADSTTTRCYIWSDGDLANHDGVYGTISDERLKQDIVDASSQWDDLKAVRFRKYRMKTDVEANPDAPYLLGVVAQELEQTSPGLVDEHPEYEEQEVTDKDGNVTTERVQVGTTKTVKSSILLMKAAVALQEAMARIEALEARLEALEA